jgi:hypothetical protein
MEVDSQLDKFPKPPPADDVAKAEVRRGENLNDYAARCALAALLLFMLGAVTGIFAIG